MSITRDDLIIRAARIVCTTDIPCAKHLEHAREILDLFEASKATPDETQSLWELVEGEAA